MYVARRKAATMKRYNKIAAELVVAPREVLEVRPRSTPPEAMTDRDLQDDQAADDERWDNSPCTD
jgi:hypothetical protein